MDQRIREWNSDPPPCVLDTIPEAVARQAEDTPHARAVEDGDTALTFREFVSAAGRLADRLRAQRITKGSMVLCSLAKEARSAVAMAAVLQLGAVVVPLDVSQPAARCQAISTATKAQVGLVTPDLSAALASRLPNMRSIVIPECSELLGVQNPENTDGCHGGCGVDAEPNDAAFVLFTSGSTGVPKGVVLDHVAICTSAACHAPEQRISPASRVLQFSDFTFDVSVYDVWSTLMRGGCVCFEHKSRCLDDVGAVIRTRRISFAALPPALIVTLRPGDVPDLQALTIVAEGPTQDLVDTWAPCVHLVNGYGSTESSTCAPAVLQPGQRAAWIGKTSGACSWIVQPDDPSQLSCVGVVGELLVEGHIMARRYLDDDAETSSKFIHPPPGSLRPHARAYLTGDLVRYCDSRGHMEYVGRKARFLKLHGRRLDPGEIEFQIRTHLGRPVHVAVLVLIDGHHQQQAPRLAAFIAFDARHLEHAEDIVLGSLGPLRDELRTLRSNISLHLPHYMIPVLYTPLLSMPLLPSGKIDRAALQRFGDMSIRELMPLATLDSPAPHVGEPCAPDHIPLATLWASVLGIPISSLRQCSNFFAVGGDSVAAIRLVAAARKNELRLSVENIFLHPTLCAMARSTQFLDRHGSLDLRDHGTNTPELRQHASKLCDVDVESIEDIVPATPFQVATIALSMRTPSAYVRRLSLKIPNSVDIHRYQEAWRRIYEMVPTLRGRVFQTPDGKSYFATVREPFKLLAFDSSAVDRPSMGAGTALVEFAVVENDRLFMWTAHHAIYDAWSERMILSMVEQVYHDGSNANPVLPSIRRFAKYCEQVTHDPAAESFWQAQFRQQSPPAQFPRTRSRREATVDAIADETAALAKGNAQSGITVATVVRAAWAMVLSCYCQSDDVVFGATTTGRTASLPDIDQIPGSTLATVPVRVRIDSDQGTLAFLSAIQEQAARMTSFEQFGLQNVRRICPASDLGDLGTLLVVQPQQHRSNSCKSLEIQITDDSWRRPDFHTLPVTLECYVHESHVEIHALFDSGLVSVIAMQRMLQTLQSLIRQLHLVAVQEIADTALSSLPYLPDVQLETIWTWNAILPPFRATTLHALVADQVRKRPKDPALVDQHSTWTYEELEIKSSILACRLQQQLDIKPGDFIPLCFSKSAMAVCAMLAVLKCGGAFTSIPIPNQESPITYPTSRVQELLQAVRANRVLCDRELVPFCTKDLGMRMALVPQDMIDIMSTSDISHDWPVDPNAIAYVMNTSGSTGTSKGVLIAHRAICTSTLAQGRALGLGPQTRGFQFSAYTFDTSIADIFTPLVNGGCVVMPTEWERVNDLAGSITRLNANFAFLTPTVINTLAPDEVPCLEVLASTGEAINDDIVSKWASRLRLFNAFGPAECAVICTIAEVPPHAKDIHSIGTATGSLTWVVDPQNINVLTPLGAVGELWIEGAILAEGYLDAPDLTAAAFVEGPAWLSDDTAHRHRGPDGRRVYRTGDLVVYNDDNSLSYVGRKDSEIKLHGQKVDLGEVEHCIAAELPNLPIAVVAIHRKQSLHIVAFIQTGFDADADQSEKTRFVAEMSNLCDRLTPKVPPSMIPSAFIPLKSFPRSEASQKTDRRGLRQLAEGLSVSEYSDYQLHSRGLEGEVRTEPERQMLNLWAQVLGVNLDLCRRRDSFLRVGGDSVSAMKLVSIARAHGYSLDVRTIIQHPTLGDMVAMVRKRDHSSNSASTDLTDSRPFGSVEAEDLEALRAQAAEQCSVPPERISDIYPCTPLQEAMFTSTLDNPEAYMSYNLFCRKSQSSSTPSLSRLLAAWRTTFSVTSILRTRIVQSQDGHFWQAVLSSECSLEIEVSPMSAESWLEEHKHDPMLPGTALFRIAVLKDDEIAIAIHHCLYDPFTWSLIIQITNSSYLGRRPPPSTTFDQFIAHVLEQNVSEQARFYWKSMLHEAVPTPYPYTSSRKLSAPRVRSSKNHKISLPQHQQIRDVLPSTIFIAAWALVLGKRVLATDVLFGTVLSGRSSAAGELADVAGPTIATVPVRVKWKPETLVREFLAQVQSDMADMLPYQHYGLQNIRKLIQPTSCTFESVLIVQDAAGLSAPNLVGYEPSKEPSTDFHTHPLNIECILQPGHDAELYARFDDTIVDADEVQMLTMELGHVVQQLRKHRGDEKLETIEIISPQERQSLIDKNTELPLACEQSVGQLFEQHAKLRPAAPAILAWDENLTYGELDQLSHRLSLYLASCCEETQDATFVVLVFEKSAWYVVALMAALKTPQCTLVPTDPAWPDNRLMEIIDRVKSRHILCSESMRCRLQSIATSLDITAVPSPALLGLRDSVSRTWVPPRLDSLAYTIFTSGSTGKPKGAMIEHASLATSLSLRGQALGIGHHTRTLQYASYGFDASLDEILLPLVHGGSVAVPHIDEVRGDVATSMARFHVNFGFLTPTVARTLEPVQLSSHLKDLVLLGEPLNAEDLKMWRAHVVLWNGYGPSEASICATIQCLSTLETPNPNNIGLPHGCVVWVVDESNPSHLVPKGCVGELWIGGPIVGRGYLSDSRATAFSRSARWQGHAGPQSARLYRTGDLVKQNQDDSLTIIGRKDTQTKIRGQRLDSSEVEHCIRTAGFAHNAVQVMQMGGHGQHLVAFVEMERGGEGVILPMSDKLHSNMQGLMRQLESDLPRHMVPTMFVPVTHIPVNTNGKTDRKLLQTLVEGLSPTKLREYLLQGLGRKDPPRNATETILRAIWSKVLAVPEEEIGVNDDWFRAGGDSISAAKLALAAKTHGLNLTVSVIMKYPKLCAMAAASACNPMSTASLVMHDETHVRPFSLLDASLLRELKESAAQQCGISPDDIMDLLPCSPMQEGMLIGSLQKRQAYTSSLAFTLSPDIDLQRFRAAWDSVVEANDILRTRIIVRSSGTFQAVLHHSLTRAIWAEMHDLPMSELGIHWQRWRKTLGPGSCLSQLFLMQHGQYFVWMMHHALYDAHTMRLFMKQAASLYASSTPDSLVSFSRYIAHMQDIQASSKAFWASYLKGETSSTFPFLARRPDPKPNNMLSRNMRRGERNHRGASSATILRAAWAIILSAYYYSNDVCWGANLSGRDANIPGVDRIAGPTISTVPVRVQLHREERVVDYVTRLQVEAAEMIPYDIGLQNIAKASPDAASACTFNVLQLISIEKGDSSQFPGIKSFGTSHLIPDADWTNLDYALVIESVILASEVTLTLSFDDSCMCRRQADAILINLEAVVSQLSTADENFLIGDVRFVPVHRDSEDLIGLGPQMVPIPADSIHSMIADRALQSPDKVAVQAWDGTVSYEELLSLSTRLALYLVEAKLVRPEAIVPICCEKSILYPIALLAVLQSGSAAMGLDATYPDQRLRDSCAIVGASTIVASTSHAARFEGSVVELSLIFLRGLPMSRNDTLLAQVRHNHAALAVMTSGSTGVPKATLLEHGHYLAGATAYAQAAGLSADSRMLQFASHAYDVSLLEILDTLMVGGTVCIPHREAALERLPQTCIEYNVNFACLTPSVVSAGLKGAVVPCLKTLVLTGEMATRSVIEEWADQLHLHNGYAPSEVTPIIALETDLARDADPCIIGPVIAGRCAIVAPDDARELPLGAVGELCFAGPTVGRGYLGEPTRTAQVFSYDPAWAPGQRCYRTGDLAKLDAQGRVHLVGRKDHQHKIRGQRLELGEIEQCMRKLLEPGTQLAVEVIQREGAGATLVSFVGLPGGFENQQREMFRDLQRQLSRQLPTYMIPSAIVPLPSARLPLLPSGKVDRKALRSMASGMPSSELFGLSDDVIEAHDSPQGSKECIVVEEVAELLGMSVAQIGRSATFQELGGDSIMAMRLVARLLARGLRVHMADVLAREPLRVLAASSQDVSNGMANARHRKGNEDEDGAAFPMSPVQRLFGRIHTLGDSDHFNHFNQSVMLQVAAHVTKATLDGALASLVQYHAALRTRVDVRAGLQSVAAAAAVNMTVRSGDDSPQAICATQKSLNLQHGPVFAATLLEPAAVDQPRLLYLVAHHYIVDLVSWRIIIDDLRRLLHLSSNGLLPTPHSVSFRTWCLEQAEHAVTSQDLPQPSPWSSVLAPDAYLDFWGINAVDNVYGNVDQLHGCLGPQSTALLLGKSNYAFTTEPVHIIAATLLLSFFQTFTQRQAITAFSEGHGRESWDPDLDVSQTVGWFTTLYPLQACVTKAGEEEDLDHLLQSIKDQMHGTSRNGANWFARQMLSADGITLPAEIMLNYLGADRVASCVKDDETLSEHHAMQLDPLLDINPELARSSLIDALGVVKEGKIHLSLHFHRSMQHRQLIKCWLERWCRLLEAGAVRLASQQRRLTASDFPLLQLSQDELKHLQVHELPARGLAPMDVEDAYPSYGTQLGILISRTRNEANYLVQIAFVETNPHDIKKEHLECAWRQVVERHASLRTFFIEAASQFYQVVVRAGSVRAEVEYFQSEDDCLDTESLVRRSPEPSHHQALPHTLSMWETPRGLLVVLKISHAIVDGHSLNVILRDWKLAYAGQLQTCAPALGYRRLVLLYQQQQQQQQQKRNLEGRPEPLSDTKPCIFPCVQDAGSVKCTLDSIERSLGVTDSRRLTAFCKTRGVTVAAVAQVCWAIVLRLYNGSRKPVFGFLHSGRDADLPGVQDAVGVYIRMLVAEVSLESPDMSLIDVLSQSYAQFLDSLRGSQSLMHVSHEAGTSQLFNTGMSVAYSSDSLTSASDDFLKPKYSRDPTEYDLAVTIDTSESLTSVTLCFWRERISSHQVEGAADVLLRALRGLLDEAAQPVDKLVNTISMSFTPFNDVPCAVDVSIVDLVFAQARKTPEMRAVHSWDGILTYHELDKLSEQAAAVLTKSGAGPGCMIPLCFEKSIWSVVAVIAILKTGAAFVPLDPSHPKQRIDAVLRCVNAKIGAASHACAEKLRHLVPNTVILARDSLAGGKGIATWQDRRSKPFPLSNLAYVLFTSGSTGVPKGVMITHEALSSGISHRAEPMGFTEGCNVLQYASAAFDVAVDEIFLTLISGGCVCVPSEQARLEDLENTMAAMHVNIAMLTPSVARLLGGASFTTFRHLILGGEHVSKEDIAAWSTRVERLDIVYGQTECTVVSTLESHVRFPMLSGSIGTPLGCMVWLVDPDDPNRIVPPGCIGEMLIEGCILAAGYLADENKTAASFVTDIAWACPERRMFRTGDLAFRDPENRLRFVGRKDSQLKFHGLRIEPGEVEASVSRLWPSTCGPVVVDSLKRDKGQILTAFVCLAPAGPSQSQQKGNGGDLSTDATAYFTNEARLVSERLRELLPPYMVPSLFIPVQAMPLLASGKLDRRRLKEAAESLTTDAMSSFFLKQTHESEPLTSSARTLKDLWVEVLDIPSQAVGMHDNFFRVGGDSYAALRLAAIVRKAGFSLAVAAIFKSPVLSDMALLMQATEIDTDGRTEGRREMVSTSDSGGVQSELHVQVAKNLGIHSQQLEAVYKTTDFQSWCLQCSVADTRAYVTYFPVRIQGPLEVSRLQKALTLLVESIPLLRTVFARHDDHFVQAVLSGSEGLATLTRYSCLVDGENGLLAAAHDSADVHLETNPFRHGEPVTSFVLLEGNRKQTDPSRATRETHILLIRLSHAQYDGFCFPALIHRLRATYTTLLPREKSTSQHSFQAYVGRLEACRTAATVYWAELLQGLAPMSLTPTHLTHDQPFPFPDTSFAFEVPICSPGPWAARPASIIQVAWGLALARVLRRSDVMFGLVTDGRAAEPSAVSDDDLYEDPLFGPCVNYIPVRMTFPPEPAPSDSILGDAERQYFDSLPFQGVGVGSMHFSSILQYQGFDVEDECASPPEASTVEFSLAGGGVGQHSRHFAGITGLFVLVESQPRGSRSLSGSQVPESFVVHFSFAAQMLQVRRVEEFRDAFQEAIQEVLGIAINTM